MKLLYKIHIKGILTLETGLHIGGSEVELDIGGIDKAVAKDSQTGLPYIPGSSLKGKLRDLIARVKNYSEHKKDLNETYLLFGGSAGEKGAGRSHGNLIVRDSFMIIEEGKNNPDDYTEDKTENNIDRIKGGANLRNLERVVRGAKFTIDMILDYYDSYTVKIRTTGSDKWIKSFYESKKYKEEDLLNTIKLGFNLLEKDYLGGSGTRGYGKVSLQLNHPVRIKFDNKGNITEEEITTFNF